MKSLPIHLAASSLLWLWGILIMIFGYGFGSILLAITDSMLPFLFYAIWGIAICTAAFRLRRPQSDDYRWARAVCLFSLVIILGSWDVILKIGLAINLGVILLLLIPRVRYSATDQVNSVRAGLDLPMRSVNLMQLNFPKNTEIAARDRLTIGMRITVAVKLLLFFFVLGSACASFIRLILNIPSSIIDERLSIPCLFGLMWAICYLNLRHVRALLAPGSALFFVFLLAIIYEVVSRYLQVRHVSYSYYVDVLSHVILAFFTGYFFTRTRDGLIVDGLVFILIYLVWIAIAIAFFWHSFTGTWWIVGLARRAAMAAPIFCTSTIAGIYLNQSANKERRLMTRLGIYRS
jgi:hypothetical protein